MDTRTSLKKTETVEIRLSHDTKAAFMARCRAEGRTASDAVRGLIEAELNVVGRRARLAGWRGLLAAALAGLALGAVAAPSLAEGVRPARAAFERLDRDHDGVLTFGEYRAR